MTDRLISPPHASPPASARAPTGTPDVAGRPTGPAAPSPASTVVHLLRHGEVENPDGILYGRLPGFHLSERGEQMAQAVAAAIAHRDVRAVLSSPLERARETAAPVAAQFGYGVRIDDRLVEATSVFEGLAVGVGDGVLFRVGNWRHLWNPFRPSWGESYAMIAARMLAVLDHARELARGHEALCVSHQLPIWIARLAVEGRRYWHDPRRRQCSLASLTSFTYEGDEIVSVAYSEPAAHLLPVKARRTFAAGA